MRRERGAGSNHTADEVTRGFRRIFGYDMRALDALAAACVHSGAFAGGSLINADGA